MGDSLIIYVGNNALFNSLITDDNGVLLDLTATGFNVLRMVFAFNDDIAIDSDVYPDAFDWTTDGAEGQVNFDFTGIEVPAGTYGARLILYSAAYLFGAVVVAGWPIVVDTAISGVDPSQADINTMLGLLADNSAGKGTDLIAHTGTANTVTQTLTDFEARISALEP